MPGLIQPPDSAGRYFYGRETEQDSYNPYDQVTRVSGQNSEIPATAWTRGLQQFSMPIPANLERPIRNPLEAQYFQSPWVPRSGDGVGWPQISARGSNTSDVPYVKLKAPKGAFGQ